MWKNYIIVAIRNLRKYRTTTFINILGITLGISIAMVIFTVLRYETSFDDFHSESKNTYRVVHHNHTADDIQYWNTTAYPLAEGLRNSIPDIRVTQAVGPLSGTFSIAYKSKIIAKFEENKILYVDMEFLKVFDFNEIYPTNMWLAGSPTSALNDPNSIVLTQKILKKYFPDQKLSPERLIGETLLYNEKELLTITGIIQDSPANTTLSFDFLISYDFFKKHNEHQAGMWTGNHQGTTFVVLPKGSELAQYEALIASVKRAHLSPEDNKRIEYKLQPLVEVHTEALYGSSIGSYVLSIEIINGLRILAGFIIFIACVNFINLATGQSLKRSREIGIRKLLGGTKKQLFLQYILEAFFITIISFSCSIFISELAIQQINNLVAFIDYKFIIDEIFIVNGLILIGLITILSGLYPGLIVSSYNPVTSLKNNVITTPKNGLSFRKLLIVFQFFIGQFLIGSTIIVASQMDYFQSKDLGYQRENILIVNIPDSRKNKLEAYKSLVLQQPDVAVVSFSSGAPTTHERQYGTSFLLSHEALELRRAAELKFVDKNYSSLYNLQLSAGTWLQDGNEIEEGFSGFVVNESLIKMLDISPEDAVGVQLIINEGQAPIVGVVKDFHNNSLHEGITPCVMVCWGTGFLDEASILLNSANPENQSITMANLEEIWKRIFPESQYQYSYVNDNLNGYYNVEKLMYLAFRIASGVAIFIACMGLYGLVSLVSLQRTKEVGIRKLLGGSILSILSLLSQDFVKLIVFAIILSTPIVYYSMNSWLQSFAYRIELQWYYIVGAGALTMLLALVTVGFQAMRTISKNPVESLRSE